MEKIEIYIPRIQLYKLICDTITSIDRIIYVDGQAIEINITIND